MNKIVLCFLVCIVVIIPLRTEAKTKKIQDAFGMNMHLHQRIPESEMETVMAQADDAHIQWAREQFVWDDIEPAKGEYDWSRYDAIVDLYEQHDINVLGLLTYSASWASSEPQSSEYEFYPPDPNEWRTYVGTVAERYAGRIDYWEIWNEPNHEGFWKSDTAAYVSLVEIAADEIKKKNPNAKIVLGGVSGSDSDYLDSVYQQIDDPARIDVVAIHPYRVLDGDFNYPSEYTVDGLNTLLTDLYNVRRVLKSYKQGSTPIWLTEAGWTTYENGISEEEQAEYLMRLYTIALSVPGVKKVFWYSFVDSAYSNDAAENRFGILHTDYSQKPAFDAYIFIQKYLTDARFSDFSFPKQRLVENFVRTPEPKWHFTGTVCTDASLQYVQNGMSLTYQFTAQENCYAPVAIQKPLREKTKALLLRLRGSNDSAVLRLRVVDRTGEVFQYNLGHTPAQWLTYSVQLHQFGGHWGGNNDGNLDRPLTLDSLIIQNTNNQMSNGSVEVGHIFSSPMKQTYLYRFLKDKKELYAFWTAGKSRSFTIQLLNAYYGETYHVDADAVRSTSGSSWHPAVSDNTVQFLQAL